ncbi:Transposase and inactivated derivatives [Edwardsiella ictaluri]|nr:Transposase and inactivated derivatives [Edwardsiella ictaluri]
MTGSKWRISDELWETMAPRIPEHKTSHPLDTHRKRVDSRAAMDAIFFVLRTGCQWNALNATGIYSSSSAHRRFQEWREVGVWQDGLLVCERLYGIDWSWLSMDGCMTKSLLSGTKNRPQSHGQRETRCKAQSDDRCQRASFVTGCGDSPHHGHPMSHQRHQPTPP